MVKGCKDDWLWKTTKDIGGKFKFENLKKKKALNEVPIACYTHLGLVFEREINKAIRVKHLLDLISF